MTDEDTTRDAQADETPRPLWVRIASWAGLGVLLGLLLWGALHVGIPPVNPKEKPPAGHYEGACWSCHVVSDKAPLGKGE